MTGKATSTLGQMTQGARPKKRVPLKVGRQTKLTPEVSKRICDAVKAGNFISVAARYAGVSEYTVNEWIQRGRGEHPKLAASPVFRQFTLDLDEAEAHAEVAAVLHWRSAMPKDWKSATKWLETRYSDRWAEKPPDQRGPAAFAALQVNFGAGSTQSGPQGVQNTLPAPISELLEENPGLIGPTMQILDQFLPNGSNTSEMAQNGAESAFGVHSDAIQGEFRVLAPESDPNDAFRSIPPDYSEFDSKWDENDENDENDA